MSTFVPTATDDPVAAALLHDYFTSRALGFTGSNAYQIRTSSPASFTPPDGIFLVCYREDRAIGCGGIRRISDVEGMSTYELKHLWIAEGSRGHGWSRRLMAELEAHARALGAALVVLDTHESLEAAQHLYRTSGYEEISPYNSNQNATHWFKKRIAEPSDSTLSP